MPSIDVKIEWDISDEEHWLNVDDIKMVLENYCVNTKFTVTEIPPQDQSQDRGKVLDGLGKSSNEKEYEGLTESEIFNIMDEVDASLEPNERWKQPPAG